MQEEFRELMVQKVAEEILRQADAAEQALQGLRDDELKSVQQSTEQLASFIRERIVQRVTMTEADVERGRLLKSWNERYPDDVQQIVRVLLRKVLEGRFQLPVKRAVSLLVQKRFGM
ncbi:MAG: hypothetical protein AAB728_04310 [Patescibacteria group bacterium]